MLLWGWGLLWIPVLTLNWEEKEIDFFIIIFGSSFWTFFHFSWRMKPLSSRIAKGIAMIFEFFEYLGC